MNKNEKQKALDELKIEAKRLMDRINEAESDLKLNEWPNPRLFAAVKRASLDLNHVAAKIRRA